MDEVLNSLLVYKSCQCKGCKNDQKFHMLPQQSVYAKIRLHHFSVSTVSE
jgi:hypothetical protein